MSIGLLKHDFVITLLAFRPLLSKTVIVRYYLLLSTEFGALLFYIILYWFSFSGS